MRFTSKLSLKGIIYSARRRAGRTAGRRREIGRFLVRPSREVEQFLAELIQVLRSLGPTPMLAGNSIGPLRTRLSSGSPYRSQLLRSLQTLGFIDSQRRFLPKAFTFVPELEALSTGIPARQFGCIRLMKAGRYGFLEDDDGTDYYFHETFLPMVQVGETLSLVPVCHLFRVRP